MNQQRINPVSAKLKRGTCHYLDGKEVYIQLDRMDGTVCITDDPKLSLGANYRDILKSDLKRQPKYNTTLKVVKPTASKKREKDEYADFYRTLYDRVPRICENCRKDLFALTNWQKKCVSAHIFPKQTFKSIATDPKNILYMGVQIKGTDCRCRCHTLWDETVENRVSPEFIHARNLAIKRFNEDLKPKMTAKEIIMAEEYLGIRAKSQNLYRDIQGGGKV